KDQPALDVIYKLSAIEIKKQWQHKLKISDQVTKTTNPGILQVRRYYKNNYPIQDIIYDELLGISEKLHDFADRYQDLLVTIFRQGNCCYQSPNVHEIRAYAITQLDCYLQNNLTELHEDFESILD